MFRKIIFILVSTSCCNKDMQWLFYWFYNVWELYHQHKKSLSKQFCLLIEPEREFKTSQWDQTGRFEFLLGGGRRKILFEDPFQNSKNTGGQFLLIQKLESLSTVFGKKEAKCPNPQQFEGVSCQLYLKCNVVFFFCGCSSALTFVFTLIKFCPLHICLSAVMHKEWL